MSINKITFKQLLMAITFAIVLSVLLFNFSLVLNYLKSLLSIFSPIFLGMIFAFVLNVPLRAIENLMNKLMNKFNISWLKKIKRGLSMLLSILLVFSVITLLTVTVIPRVLEAINVLTQYVQKLLGNSNDIIEWVKIGIEPFGNIQDYFKKLNLDWEELMKQAFGLISGGVPSLLSVTASFILTLFDSVINVILAFIIAIYILSGKEKLQKQSLSILRAVFSEKIYKKTVYILSMCNKRFAQYFVGQSTEALVLGVLCFVGMAILKIPYAPMISALLGVLALIPIVGPFIAVSLGTFMILMVNPIQALVFLIFFIVLQQIDGNFIYPRIVGSSVGLPPLLVISAIIIGGGLFKITGVFFAVPVMSVIYTIVKESVQAKVSPHSKLT